jgi:hypothetical protein
MVLTARRDFGLLATLREGSLASLVEMARWKSEGHALAAFAIFGTYRRSLGRRGAGCVESWRSRNRHHGCNQVTLIPSNIRIKPTRLTIKHRAPARRSFEP